MELNKRKTLDVSVIAFFAALTAICSQISIPLPFTPVPLNLALFSVFMSGSILGSRKGAMSQTIYVLLGCLGLPVFANMRGGIGVVIGPTGGYIVGYIITSFIVGLFVKIKQNFIVTGLSMTVGLVACYIIGTAWFVFITQTRIWNALLMCVFPFLIGDILKIFLAATLSQRLKEIYKHQFI